MGKKRVFIIHGLGGAPSQGFLGWLEQEIAKKGYFVKSPAMATPSEPKVEEWVAHIARLVGNHHADCYLVGYSLGANAVLRYLQTLQKGQTLAGVLFIAPSLHINGVTPQEREMLAPWVDKKISFDIVKRHMNKSTAIFSDDDPVIPLVDARYFKENLDSRVIIEKGKGHFDSAANLPSALNVMLSYFAKGMGGGTR